MSKKRIYSLTEYSTKAARLSPASKRTLYAALLDREPIRVLAAEAALDRPAGRAVRPATALPRLSTLPYAVIMSMMSVGLLVMIRLFVAGGLPLSVFLLGGLGVIGGGLLGCVYIAVKSWRALAGLRQWRSELELQPSNLSWE